MAAVDFFRTYADRYHHGKEEGILFNDLYKRKLSEADAAVMRELILEHATARRTVITLEKQEANYISGNAEALGSILESLITLIELYPRHIEKEDKHFFFPVHDLLHRKRTAANAPEILGVQPKLHGHPVQTDNGNSGKRALNRWKMSVGFMQQKVFDISLFFMLKTVSLLFHDCFSELSKDSLTKYMY